MKRIICVVFAVIVMTATFIMSTVPANAATTVEVSRSYAEYWNGESAAAVAESARW